MDPHIVKGVVAAFISPKEPGLKADMDRWLDQYHCPEVAQTPGLIGWTRYANIDPQAGQPTHLNLYECDRDAASVKAAFDQCRGKWTRPSQQLTDTFHLGFYDRIFPSFSSPLPSRERTPGVSREGEGSRVPEGLMIVATICTDKARDAEYNKWYNTQHGPAIIATPGMTGIMRFKCATSMMTPIEYLQTFIIGKPDVAAVRKAMTETLGKAQESVRSSGGLAKSVLVAAFKRIGERHAVKR